MVPTPQFCVPCGRSRREYRRLNMTSVKDEGSGSKVRKFMVIVLTECQVYDLYECQRSSLCLHIENMILKGFPLLFPTHVSDEILVPPFRRVTRPLPSCPESPSKVLGPLCSAWSHTETGHCGKTRGQKSGLFISTSHYPPLCDFRKQGRGLLSFHRLFVVLDDVK